MHPSSAPHSEISSRNSVLPTEPIRLPTIDIARVSDRTIESLFVVRQQPLTATLSFDPVVLKRKALPAFILAGNDDEKEPSISSARVRMGEYPARCISSREVGYGTVSPTEDATTRTVAIYRRSKVWP